MKPNFTFTIIAIAAYVAGAQAASCLEKAASYSKLQGAQSTCLTTLNLTSADIPVGKELKEKHFNDRCMSSCVMQSLNFYNNGTILKDTILETFKKEVASDVYDKLAKIVEKCVEKATTKPFSKKDKDGKDKESRKSSTPRTRDMKTHHHEHGNVPCSCRRAAKFVYCMMEKDKKAEC